MDKEETFGMYRVGSTFNPSGSPLVDEIKTRAAELIDLIDNRIESTSGEVGRLKSLAMTDIESAAMWAVKAVTKKPR